jgi:hypothetical protein
MCQRSVSCAIAVHLLAKEAQALSPEEPEMSEAAMDDENDVTGGDEEASEVGTRTPPYVSFKTWMTLIEDLQTHGLPPQIDRSVLSRFAGGTGSQLLMSLRSLGLTDRNNKPHTRMAQLVNAHGTDQFKPLLRAVLKDAYPFLSKMNLTTATPSMFADAFKVTGAKEDVLRKCRTFYLHAAQFAEVEIGPRLLQAKTTRPLPSGAPKKRTAAKPKVRKPADAERERPIDPDTARDSVANQLLAKFPSFDPNWPDEIKAKWFEGYERLLKMGEGK